MKALEKKDRRTCGIQTANLVIIESFRSITVSAVRFRYERKQRIEFCYCGDKTLQKQPALT